VSRGYAPALPATAAFALALRGAPCHVHGLAGLPQPLPLAAWAAEADLSDDVLLGHCRGTTLDVGCGPGRLSLQLARRGHPSLGIDVTGAAVEAARARGAMAMVRDVFGPVPAEGRWGTVLLADGNIGIGGEPTDLLARVRDLVAPGGRVVADVAAPGVGLRRRWLRLETPAGLSAPFRWAFVGADAIGFLAGTAGLRLDGLHMHDGRWFSVLGKAA
jgi:SAM-dependent methyltransferase